MERESIQWRAIYRDGEMLAQYEGERENRYVDIDRSKLASFALLKDGLIKFMVHMDHPDQRLIYRRRVFMKQSADQSDGKRVFHLIGWRRKISDTETIQAIAVMGEDGSVDLISKWREDHVLFETPVILPCEEIADAVA